MHACMYVCMHAYIVYVCIYIYINCLVRQPLLLQELLLLLQVQQLLELQVVREPPQRLQLLVHSISRQHTSAHVSSSRALPATAAACTSRL